jgi:hypothetical protein
VTVTRTWSDTAAAARIQKLWEGDKEKKRRRRRKR